MKTLTVEVQDDHLQKIALNRKPIAALAELIWNAVDADASNVEVHFAHDFSGGITVIRVEDDGTGLRLTDAEQGFTRLGGSWKLHTRRTRRDSRILHGQKGSGRLQAFSLGSVVTWDTVYEVTGGTYEALRIVGRADDLRHPAVSDPKPADGPAGTTVRVEEIRENVAGLDGKRIATELAEVFAFYLREYPLVRIVVDGHPVDPSLLEARRETFSLPATEARGRLIADARLTVIEWNAAASRSLYVCTKEGFALQTLPASIQAPGFNFTAYVASEYMDGLVEDQSYMVGELDVGVQQLAESARARLRDYFRQRRAEEAAEAVAEWKREDIYPYEGTPQTVVDQTTREVFDVVASNVNAHLKDFATADRKTKQFSLLLLKQAIESNPESLQKIIKDVLDLPSQKQNELAELLEKTSLSAIISAAKVVADRLHVLKAIETMVFEKESRRVMRERTQLHRILADHTWIFGEEFNLSVDDESLTAVLKAHMKELGRHDLVEQPVLREDGSVGIVDLMLSRRIPHPRPDQREHLVIELKRPSQPITRDVMSQIEDYALAVSTDERFEATNTKWIFWAISNDLAEAAKARAHQPDRPPGLIHRQAKPDIEIWVKSWGQVFDECAGRLHFFMRELNLTATRDEALEVLRRTHGKYFPANLQEEPGEPELETIRV
jgi:hypothetical protein